MHRTTPAYGSRVVYLNDIESRQGLGRRGRCSHATKGKARGGSHNDGIAWLMNHVALYRPFFLLAFLPARPPPALAGFTLPSPRAFLLSCCFFDTLAAIVRSTTLAWWRPSSGNILSTTDAVRFASVCESEAPTPEL